MKSKLALAALVATMVCGSAEAVPYTLISPGTQTAFSFDYAGGYITSMQTITSFTSSTNVSSAQFCFAGQRCGFNGNYVPVQEGIYTISNGASGAASIGLLFDFANGTFERAGIYSAQSYSGIASHSGTLTVGDPTSAVPEPATWAMMILGMGAVGYAMRRRRVRASEIKFDDKIKRMTAGATA